MAFIHYICTTLHKIWRLEIGMWPLSMGEGDVGLMRSASTASEAVGGCSALGCFNS